MAVMFVIGPAVYNWGSPRQTVWIYGYVSVGNVLDGLHHRSRLTGPVIQANPATANDADGNHWILPVLISLMAPRANYIVYRWLL